MTTAADEAFAWMDRWWDDDVAMLWNPPGSFDGLFPPSSLHLVPQTVWHALAMLATGDVARAARAITAVLACQLDEPGTPWHGTFGRFREFPRPRPGAVAFVGYDPNWRQFVGTGLCLALSVGGDRLDGQLTEAMVAAIELAVDGEPEDRVCASYSNIALMRAWLDVAAGDLLDRPDLVARGEAFAQRIVDRFDRHGTFDEWNSPTYYGIDFYALALWRTRGPVSSLRAWGEHLEEVLWCDMAPWYHAALGNLAGPFTRAYGMDMRRYAAAAGLWIREACAGVPPVPDVGASVPPVPDVGEPFSHSHDLALAPVIPLLGVRVPASAAPHLRRFIGERVVERQVSSQPERIASAWMAPSVMVGGERGDRAWPAQGQYHPATVHWLEPSGRTRWIRAVHAGLMDARAHPGALRLQCRGADVRTAFLMSAHEAVTADRWVLPGLTVRVRTNAIYAGLKASGDIHEACYEAPASATTEFELSFET